MVIVFLAIRFGAGSKKAPEQQIVEAPSEQVVTPITKPVKSGVSGGEAVVSNLSYGEAVEKYKGRRIQFDQSCQAIPSNQSFKIGTSIMLDNRSPKPATIALDGSVYLVEAYGYQIVSLQKEGLFNGNCNAQKNVLTISVQK